MVRGVLVDLSGVLYVGGDAVEGAARSLDALRLRGISRRFVTNATRLPATGILERLAKMGFESGKTATILGKPSKDFFQAAVEDLGCEPGETVMVGDDALADVDGALAAGIQGILVKTGKYQQGDESKITRPGAKVLADINAVVDWILKAA